LASFYARTDTHANAPISSHINTRKQTHLQAAVQKIGSFFQRVGAVGDHHAGHFGPRQLGLQAGVQRHPGGVVHVRTVQIGQLQRLQRLLAQQRHRGDQVLHFQRACGVTQMALTMGRLGGASDRAAGAHNHHPTARDRIALLFWHSG